jgi:hypothetical protein
MGIRGGEGRQIRGLKARQRGSWVDLGCWVMRGAVNLDKNWARNSGDAGDCACGAVAGR